MSIRVPVRRRVVLAALAAILALPLSTGAGRAEELETIVPPGTTQGVPWNGARGITETVAEIMAREKAAPPRPQELELEVEPPRMRTVRQQPNPKSPAVAQWPPSDAELGTEQTEATQSVGISFPTIGFIESGFIPPDTMGAVGPTQIVASSNGRIKTFNKTNGADGTLNVTMNALFASVRNGSGVSDPHLRYDRLSGRWFVVGITTSTPNRVVIAVSSSSTITSTASFTFFFFQHDQVGPTPNSDTGGFCDYPTLGVDRDALYIGGNIFNAAGTALIGTTGYVVNKANLLTGSLTVTAFRQLATGSSTGPWSPQGAQNDDPASTEGYFIGSNNPTFGTLVLRRVSTPGGTPSISGNILLTVPTTSDPITQKQMGSTTDIDALDDRLFAAQVRKNKITGAVTLWTAHNISVNSSGVGCSLCVGGGRNGSRWYEIGSLTTTPTLVQSGTLFDSQATNPRGYWIPSVAGTGQGHMVLGSSMASPNDFAGVSTAGRLRDDAAGSTQAPTLVQPGGAAYVLLDNSQRNRWGDFSQTSVDPDDDQTVWTLQEYVSSANRWALYAVQLRAPGPATPTSASPPSICQGVASTNVVVTGTSSGGSEFFDPGPDTGGPGFLRHLSATVSGGVVVQGTTFTDPTHLTLALGTLAASAGAKNVTIKNPDQQIAIGLGLLTVDPTPDAAPANDGPLCQGQTLHLSTPSFPSATYQWTGPNGFASTDQNPTVPNAGPADAGTYTVTVTAGACSSTPATTTVTILADGAACDDHTLCTTGDQCTAGTCSGTLLDCSSFNGPCAAGVCNTGTGSCEAQPTNEGNPCDDGDPCTLSDTCTSGSCVGAPSQPSEVDAGLRVSQSGGTATLTWNPAFQATSHDVLRGDLAELPVGPGRGDAGELCLADNLAATTTTDATDLLPNTGFWYLIRGENACGHGPYGFEGNHGAPSAPRISAVCP